MIDITKAKMLPREAPRIAPIWFRLLVFWEGIVEGEDEGEGDDGEEKDSGDEGGNGDNLRNVR